MVGRTAGRMLVGHRLTAPSRLKQVGDVLQSPAKGPVQTAAAFRICSARHALIHVFRSPGGSYSANFSSTTRIELCPP